MLLQSFDLALHSPTGGLEPFTVRCGRLHVIVGPNNAGKSLLLRELSCTGPRLEHVERARRSVSIHRFQPLPGKLVTGAAWSDQAEARIAQEVIESEIGPKRGLIEAALRRLPWPQVRPVVSRNALAALRAVEIADTVTGASEILVAWQRLVLAFLRPETPPPNDPLIAIHEVASGMFEPLGIAPPSVDALLALLARLRTTDKSAHTALLINLAMAPETLDAGEHTDVLRQVRGLAPFVFDARYWHDLAARLEHAWSVRAWGHSSAPDDFARSVLYLDGTARLTLTSPEQLVPAEQSNDSAILLRLLDNEGVRKKLRDLVFDGLGQWLVVDMHTQAPDVILRLAATPPDADVETRRAQRSSEYMRAAEDLRERSDGTHAYIGMLAAIVTSTAHLVFVDEPEAFLHPPLARTFARQLALLAKDGRQVFVSTHSPEVVGGAVIADPSAQILRLTYADRQSRAWQLDPATLRRFSVSPRLRGAQALGGLFADVVVVCEGDTDRVFYQEVWERIVAAERADSRGDSWAFLNAQGWQSARDLVGPLRRMGVPAAAIVDLDVLNQPELKALLQAALIPADLIAGWTQTLGRVREHAAVPRLDGATAQQLAPEARHVLDEILVSMGRWGVFVVPVGALEGWLRDHIGADVSKERWISEAFRIMGDDPERAGWLSPGDGDVWAFLRAVAAWARCPTRNGMP